MTGKKDVEPALPLTDADLNSYLQAFTRAWDELDIVEITLSWREEVWFDPQDVADLEKEREVLIGLVIPRIQDQINTVLCQPV